MFTQKYKLIWKISRNYKKKKQNQQTLPWIFLCNDIKHNLYKDIAYFWSFHPEYGEMQLEEKVEIIFLANNVLSLPFGLKILLITKKIFQKLFYFKLFF